MRLIQAISILFLLEFPIKVWADENLPQSGAVDLAKFCAPTKIDHKESLEKAKQVLPPNGTYDLNSPNWPKVNVEEGKLKVAVPNGSSMCTSATCTVFLQQVADTLNSAKVPISSDMVSFLSDKKSLVKFGMNGNTFAPAALINALGGVSVSASGPGEIKKMLEQAQPGDQFIYSRAKGGHATTFVGLKGDEACFLSSQKRTNGMAEACVSISKLKVAALSRLPTNPETLSANLKALMNKNQQSSDSDASGAPGSADWWSKTKKFVSTVASNVMQKLRGLIRSQESANKVEKSDINWSSSLPKCPAPGNTSPMTESQRLDGGKSNVAQ